MFLGDIVYVCCVGCAYFASPSGVKLTLKVYVPAFIEFSSLNTTS